MKTAENQKTETLEINTQKTFKGITHFDDEYSLKGTTFLEEFLVMEDMILIRATTSYKEKYFYKEGNLKGKTLIRGILVENGKVFLKGTTYIRDGAPKEGETLIRLSDFKRDYPLEEVDLLGLKRCLR
ncbi:hypothetical protein [Candidatus Thiodiazotropha endoloripes]|uniref:Uncharacterized protein n=1 Tax=Candidatus Thiodiazotropha endoloripes TaxID=1818881 RepID=A0A1E2URG0_9GAMM|nr:hypothetical protein [Candidatus Thiodiazotropha endoloripes]MCG7984537.1 hypothetical protein [Candidatus Thiodiazotropha lotti]ODB97084.1 hypothetical protein A3196_10085 [Candidatus Thiodiazotropha endoloripes]